MCISGNAKTFSEVTKSLGKNFNCITHIKGGFCLDRTAQTVVNYTIVASKDKRLDFLKSNLQKKIKLSNIGTKINISPYRGDYWVKGMAKDSELKDHYTYYMSRYSAGKLILLSFSLSGKSKIKSKIYFSKLERKIFK